MAMEDGGPSTSAAAADGSGGEPPPAKGGKEERTMSTAQSLRAAYDEELKTTDAWKHPKSCVPVKLGTIEATKCGICFRVITRTMMIKSCLHRFCKACFIDYINKGGEYTQYRGANIVEERAYGNVVQNRSKVCPVCRAHVGHKRNAVEDHKFDAIIRALYGDPVAYNDAAEDAMEAQFTLEEAMRKHRERTELLKAAAAKNRKDDDKQRLARPTSQQRPSSAHEHAPAPKRPKIEEPAREPVSGVRAAPPPQAARQPMHHTHEGWVPKEEDDHRRGASRREEDAMEEADDVMDDWAANVAEADQASEEARRLLAIGKAATRQRVPCVVHVVLEPAAGSGQPPLPEPFLVCDDGVTVASLLRVVSRQLGTLPGTLRLALLKQSSAVDVTGTPTQTVWELQRMAHVTTEAVTLMYSVCQG